MFSIRWPYLTAIAGGAGLGVGVMVLLLNREREKFANRAAFIESALRRVREQPTALSLLGDDFKVGRASLQDGWGKMDTTQVRVRLPLLGKNDNGQLYVYARKKDEKAKYRLFKLEMTFDKLAGKKLILMDRGEDVNEEEDDALEKELEARAKEKVKTAEELKTEELRRLREARIEEQKKKLALLQDRNNHPTLKLNKPPPATT